MEFVSCHSDYRLIQEKRTTFTADSAEEILAEVFTECEVLINKRRRNHEIYFIDMDVIMEFPGIPDSSIPGNPGNDLESEPENSGN